MQSGIPGYFRNMETPDKKNSYYYTEEQKLTKAIGER